MPLLPEHPTSEMIDAGVRMHQTPRAGPPETLVHDIWQSMYEAYQAENTTALTWCTCPGRCQYPNADGKCKGGKGVEPSVSARAIAEEVYNLDSLEDIACALDAFAAQAVAAERAKPAASDNLNEKAAEKSRWLQWLLSHPDYQDRRKWLVAVEQAFIDFGYETRREGEIAMRERAIEAVENYGGCSTVCNCSAATTIRALWPTLSWRHAGFGALQAYIREGGEEELRAHVWHPSLIKPGIEESGLCHDHRFEMRSSVLAGSILQTEFRLESDPTGYWETYRVLHAREAMARGGSFHHDPVSTGERYKRYPLMFEFEAGFGYTFDKFAFHETRARDATVTLVEKSLQEDVNARILAPHDKPIVHAFTETRTQEDCQEALDAALAALHWHRRNDVS